MSRFSFFTIALFSILQLTSKFVFVRAQGDDSVDQTAEQVAQNGVDGTGSGPNAWKVVVTFGEDTSVVRRLSDDDEDGNTQVSAENNSAEVEDQQSSNQDSGVNSEDGAVTTEQDLETANEPVISTTLSTFDKDFAVAVQLYYDVACTRSVVELKKNFLKKIFGYLARCEGNFCTTTPFFLKKSSQNRPKCRQNAVKI